MGEAALDCVPLEVPDPSAFLGSGPNACGSVHFPDAIVLHVPEGIVGADPGSVRAEEDQEAFKLTVDELVGYESGFASDTPADGPEGKQWLVRGAFASVPPDVQLLEALQEIIRQDSTPPWD